MSPLAVSSACKTFSATARWLFVCVAAYTVAIPPAPRTRSIRHFPAKISPTRRAATSSGSGEDSSGSSGVGVGTRALRRFGRRASARRNGQGNGRSPS